MLPLPKVEEVELEISVELLAKVASCLAEAVRLGRASAEQGIEEYVIELLRRKE